MSAGIGDSVNGVQRRKGRDEVYRLLKPNSKPGPIKADKIVTTGKIGIQDLFNNPGKIRDTMEFPLE